MYEITAEYASDSLQVSDNGRVLNKFQRLSSYNTSMAAYSRLIPR